MPLAQYRKKRDFARTREPRGAPRRAGKAAAQAPIFIVQKHDASHLHYDFRLEHAGVLKSWAIPKGPSPDPSKKSLAVEVEDHPVEYGSFEGTIPQGQYGGGTVMLWDRGTWEPDGDPAAGLRAGKLKFRLHGTRLRGGWTLVRMGGRAGHGGKNWLLIKERDAEARDAGAPEPPADNDRSVKTGRKMDEIASGRRAAPGPPKPRAAAPPEAPVRRPAAPPAKKPPKVGARTRAKRSAKPDPSALPGARRAPMPATLSPELAVLVTEPPAGDAWLHEVKFDGYRTLCTIEARRVRLLTRTGNDWTAKFPSIAAAAGQLNLRSAVLDGEIIALAPDGRPDFQALQNVLKKGAALNLSYHIFDLLYYDGYDLRGVPLIERKRLIEQLLAGASDTGPIRYSDHITGRGGAVWQNACRMRLEGVVSKQADSIYSGRRSGAWVKVKCGNRQEFVIGGFTAPRGSRVGFGALLVGVHENGGPLTFCGKVGTGYDERTLGDLLARLRRLETPRPPFVKPPERRRAQGVHWVRPELVAEIEFAQWTRDGLLRHPAFVGLREDKPAAEVVREQPHAAPRAAPPRVASSSAHPPSANTRPSRRRSAGAVVAGVTITNPDRPLYPEEGLTKLDVARYYEQVARLMLPHIAGRPLNLVRCPNGLAGACFYQKHASGAVPAAVKQVDVGEDKPYAAIEDVAGLVSLVQMGVLEIHPWGCRVGSLDKPDRVILDLDPGPGVEWPTVIDAARLVRKRLEAAGLTTFVKTSGGKGLHLMLPLDATADWSTVKSWAKSLCLDLAQEHPDRFVAVAGKAQRPGRIFLDYLRNARGATAIAPYSTRARAGAAVSAPLAWAELGRLSSPTAFTIKTIPARLRRLRAEPWNDFLKVRQSLPGA